MEGSSALSGTEQDSPKAPVFETTWLEGVVEINWTNTPDGGVILQYVLGNGHRYVVPLKGESLKVTRAAVSPVVVAGANEMPPASGNSHQA